MKFKYLLLLFIAITPFSEAGVDIRSTVARVQLKGDGKLWIKMTDSRFDTYCKPGWYGFSMYIPEADKSYPYYYGLITSALAKGQNLFIANISLFDGSSACDLTKTGYGIVVENN